MQSWAKVREFQKSEIEKMSELKGIEPAEPWWATSILFVPKMEALLFWIE